MNNKACVHNFNCHIETKAHLKVISSQIRCESGNISEMARIRDAVTTDTNRK